MNFAELLVATVFLVGIAAANHQTVRQLRLGLAAIERADTIQENISLIQAAACLSETSVRIPEESPPLLININCHTPANKNEQSPQQAALVLRSCEITTAEQSPLELLFTCTNPTRRGF